MANSDIGLMAGFVLTLMVFSYVLGDNLLYRLAVYVFVGLVAGFITVVTVDSVLLPFFDATIGSKDPLRLGAGLLPVMLGLLLVMKASPRLARFGNLGITFIIGVGAAVALVGALTGTLLPLALDSADLNANGRDPLDGALIFLGVISSLMYFQYIAAKPNTDGEPRRLLPVRAMSVVGEGFIMVTLGALYAAAILTSLTILTERIAFLLGGG